jgi:hypothetical protein
MIVVYVVKLGRKTLTGPGAQDVPTRRSKAAAADELKTNRGHVSTLTKVDSKIDNVL